MFAEGGVRRALCYMNANARSNGTVPFNRSENGSSGAAAVWGIPDSVFHGVT